MLSFSHTLISLTFGIYLAPHPWLALLAAFIFHLVCDAVYHWNIYRNKSGRLPFSPVSLEVLLGLLTAWLILGDRLFWPAVIAAVAGGNLPDILSVLNDILLRHRQRYLDRPLALFFRLHDQLQWETNNIIGGLIPQLILVAISIILVK